MIGRVWITGASSGIGRATALRFAATGAMVAASARRAEELAKLAAAVPGRILAFPADVTDRAQMAAAVDAIEAALGPLDLALFNAGTHQPDSIGGFDADAFRRLMEINFMGAVNGIAAVLPRFLARKAGHIAVVSSVAGYRGLPEAAAYGASKAALINLCEALKLELEPYGVAVSLVTPGFVRTPLTDRNRFPMPFLMEADAAARRLVAGLERRTFEISFPRRFTYLLKLARLLPYALYFPLVRAATGRGGRGPRGGGG